MNARPVLLTVVANRRKLEMLKRFLAAERYEAVKAAALEEFDAVLSRGQVFKLALVDISGFDRGVWARREQVRRKGVPFLVVSPKHSAAIRQENLTHGAWGVLVKPLATRELATLVRNLIADCG